MTILVDVALSALEGGEVIVLPTDTVYGIGVDPNSPEAVAKLFALKERPSDKPIPVLGADLVALENVASFDDRARALAERFWPGPLTMVLDRAPGFDADLGGTGEEGVAVRVPAHQLARELLARSGPLAITSANLSGGRPAAFVDQARATFGDRVAVYVDGGVCDDPASTIVSLRDGFSILRTGAITDEDIHQTLRTIF